MAVDHKLCKSLESKELTGSTKETIKKLLDLRELDEKLTHLDGRIADGPRIYENRARELKEAQSAVELKREAIKQKRLEAKNQEIQLKSREEEIKKQETYLLSAKTNQEYSTIQGQIKRIQEEVGTLEESILQFLEGVEEDARELAELERELKIQQVELDAFKKSVDEDVAAYAEEKASVLAQREAVFNNLDFDAAQIYDRVKNARGGAGVVSAEGSTCGGCFMTVTPNDIARLRGLNELVLCKSCQRILYLPELIE